MTSPLRHRFGDFVLDTSKRSLQRGGVPVALNARYFDALALLVGEEGRLVGKQRFFDEVWADSVVTDAALTQCIKEIRRLLGDDAANPRFVRTVAGHGYCFIAEVVSGGADAAPTVLHAQPVQAAPAAQTVQTAQMTQTAPTRPPPPSGAGLKAWLGDAAAAAVGGGCAGLLGGLLYGSALAFSPQAQGLGSLSVLLVLLSLTVLVGLAGAMGVGLGLGAAALIRPGPGPGWVLAGGACGGLLVGGLVKLLTSDAFALLVGHAPSGLTGGLEGAAIGLAVAAGLLLGGGWQARQARRPALLAALTTGLAGALLALAGGSMMATSLLHIAAAFDASRLDMAPLGRLFGEPQFGLLARASLGALEGGLFGGCLVAALLLWRRYAEPAPGQAITGPLRPTTPQP